MFKSGKRICHVGSERLIGREERSVFQQHQNMK